MPKNFTKNSLKVISVLALMVSSCNEPISGSDLSNLSGPFVYDSCSFDQGNIREVELNSLKTYFIQNLPKADPTEKEIEDAWLIVTPSLGVTKVEYYDFVEKKWKDSDLIILAGLSADMEIETQEGYPVKIEVSKYGNTKVTIFGGMCSPDVNNS